MDTMTTIPSHSAFAGCVENAIKPSIERLRMSELTITEVEVDKELPSWQGKGAKVYRLTVEGDERRPELFVPNDQQPPKVGETIPGIEDSDYGPKVKRQAKGGGGFKRSPAETAAIQRQHSQDMALQREANMIAAGHRPYTGEQLRSVINWFDEDIKGKDRAIKWDGMTDDVPADQTDLDLQPS